MTTIVWWELFTFRKVAHPLDRNDNLKCHIFPTEHGAPCTNYQISQKACLSFHSSYYSVYYNACSPVLSPVDPSLLSRLIHRPRKVLRSRHALVKLAYFIDDKASSRQTLVHIIQLQLSILQLRHYRLQ